MRNAWHRLLYPAIMSSLFALAHGASAASNEVDLIVGALPLEHGTPTPHGYGVTQLPVDSVVTNTVNTPADETNGTRYVCTGWAGSGSVPASGTTNTVTFTISTNATLIWHWETQYSLTAETLGQHGPYTGTHGSLDVPTAPSRSWYDQGGNAVITASADGRWTFDQWSGATNGSDNPLTLPMNSPVTNLIANFVYTPNGSNWSLTVSSAYGNPTPPVGTTPGIADGTVTNCTVEQSVTVANTQQYCLGWTASGSAPSSGSGNDTGLFVMTEDTAVTWNWLKRYKLTMIVTNDGTTDPAAGDSWQNANGYVTVTATPDGGATFVGWSGTNTNDVVISTNQVSVFTDEFLGPSLSHLDPFGFVIPQDIAQRSLHRQLITVDRQYPLRPQFYSSQGQNP